MLCPETHRAAPNEYQNKGTYETRFILVTGFRHYVRHAGLCRKHGARRAPAVWYGRLGNAVIKRHSLDRKHAIDIQVVPLSSENAIIIALQGKAVDVIVSDWISVNRQRAAGKDYCFFPYSLSVGGLYVRPDAVLPRSPIWPAASSVSRVARRIKAGCCYRHMRVC